MKKAGLLSVWALMVTMVIGCSHSNHVARHNPYQYQQQQQQNQGTDYRYLSPNQNYPQQNCPDHRYPQQRYPQQNLNPYPQNMQNNAYRLVDEINRHRQRYGVQPVSHDYSLNQRAQNIANDVNRNSQAYRYAKGEFVAYTSDPSYAVRQWQRNIVSNQYMSSPYVRSVGVAQAYGTYGTIWVAVFR